MSKTKREKIIIGRREIANLPQFGLMHVAVKVDSGAYTSSIHVTSCNEIELEGATLLAVVFLDANHPSFDNETHYFSEYRMKKVRSSTGQEQLRYFIYCTLDLLGQQIKTEFSLTERKGMRFPILLGRKLLNNRFIIDTSLKNTHKNT
jgi:hypothetical protein